MQCWEYRQVQVSLSSRGIEAAHFTWEDDDTGGPKVLESYAGNDAWTWAYTVMARLGKSAWELASTTVRTTPEGCYEYHYYFKRPLSDEPYSC